MAMKQIVMSFQFFLFLISSQEKRCVDYLKLQLKDECVWNEKITWKYYLSTSEEFLWVSRLLGMSHFYLLSVQRKKHFLNFADQTFFELHLSFTNLILRIYRICRILFLEIFIYFAEFSTFNIKLIRISRVVFNVHTNVTKDFGDTIGSVDFVISHCFSEGRVKY